MKYTKEEQKKLILNIFNLFDQLNIILKNINIKYNTKELIKIHNTIDCDYEKCIKKAEYKIKNTNINICWSHSLL